MMERLNKKQFEKQNRINEIKEAIKKVREKKRELNNKLFLMDICSKYYVSLRTAREYYQIALHQLK